MGNVLDRIGEAIETKVEVAFVNDVQKVYEAKIAEFGGYSNMTTADRRLAIQTSKDEVATRLKYKIWNMIW